MKIKLNLISEQQKKVIRETKKMRMVFKLGAELLGILLVFFILLLNINYVLKTDLSLAVENFNKKSLDEKYAEMERYDSEIKQINSEIADIENIQREQTYWSRLLFKLSDILGPDIALTNLSTKNLTIFLVGKAKTRDALVLLKGDLEKEECFFDVKLPLSNLVSKDDAVFQMEFSLKEECVKEK